MLIRNLAFLIILLCTTVYAKSQNFYTIKYGKGKVIESYSKMPATRTSTFTAFEFGKKSKGYNEWEKLLGYPEYGIEVLYGNLNNDFLGDLYAVHPFLRIPLTDKENKFKIYFNGGLGFGLFTKKYHLMDNPENGLIGSSLTNYTKGEIEFAYNFDRYKIFLDAGAFHFSNGHVNLPNIGANVPEIKLGITYYQRGENEDDKVIDKVDKKWKSEITYGVGFHSYGSTMNPFGGPVYNIHSLSYAYGKNINAAYKISFGNLISWYDSYYNFLKYEEKLTKEESLKNSISYTIFFGQELTMGKIGLYGQFGIDIYKPFIRNYGDIFDKEKGFSKIVKSYNSNRLGLKYYLKRINQDSYNMSIGMFIKANYAQADFAEISLSFII